MCGRYEMFLTPENKEMMQIMERISKKYGPENNMKMGEIFPTNTGIIFAAPKEEIAAELSIWGFPNFRNKGVIINARAETAIEKPTFRKSLLERRCAVPSTGFYEWKQDGTKQKYRFHLPEEPNLYMAGIWTEWNGEKRYVILTTSANDSMKEIHNRMPVVLRKEDVRDWIRNTEKALSILEKIPPELEAEKIEK